MPRARQTQDADRISDLDDQATKRNMFDVLGSAHRRSRFPEDGACMSECRRAHVTVELEAR